MSTSHHYTVTTKRRSTSFACVMAEGFSFRIHLPRIVSCYFHPPSAFCLYCSIATTTYVVCLPTPFPRLLIIHVFSTLLTNCLRLMSAPPTRTQMISPRSDPERQQKIAIQDEDIFQTARLINCSWFGSAIFTDYFSSILGLVRQGSTWSLNPFNVRGSFSLFRISLANYMCSGNSRGGSQALRAWSWQCLQR
jgi:hypothetical protein